ncbi:MAG: 2-nitropropane dioxygenase [Deltaproteobacteria bacterium SG8_13]|nr:MAG: 2-nitropropane dioxygenase [Deltaproteobacteria bacterium SG8_13]
MKLPELKIGDLVSKVPIIQGGMGVAISLSRMASAVANEGGIGVIAAAIPGVHEPDFATNTSQANIRVLRREIRKARQKTSGILGVNIMVALTDFAEMVKTSLQEGIDIIFAGAGLPLDLPGYRSEDSHTRLVPIVSSARAARIICQKWLSRYAVLPDAVVVEGPMAGGHIGFKNGQIDDPGFSLEHLVAEVIEAVRPFEEQHRTVIPVVAAGGIYGGEDIYRYLKLGAAGVQMGTRFVATHECDADDAFKQMYIDAGEEDMVIIKSPVGLPGRAIRNSFLDEVDRGKRKIFKCPFHCIKTCDAKKSPYCIAMALGNASRGKFKHGFAFAGKNAHRIKEILSVKELIDRLTNEFGRAASVAPQPIAVAG